MGIQVSPLVSIVISIYRRETYLAQAINSALNQTWPHVEILVAEDGGSDCAQPVVAGFALPEDRLRLIRQPVNIGAAANKLQAWNAARGEFIVNLDDDDLLEPNFISRLLPPLLQDPTLVLSFCDHFLIDENNTINQAASDENTRTWKRDTLAPGLHRPFLELGLVHQSIPFAMGALWSRSRLNLNDFRTESGPAYDLFMTYVAARTELGAYYVPERLTRYRVHAAMETRTGRDRIHRASIFCNRLFLDDPALVPWRPVFRERLADSHASLAASCLTRGDRITALIHFGRSLTIRPTRRAAGGVAACFLPRKFRKTY